MMAGENLEEEQSLRVPEVNLGQYMLDRMRQYGSSIAMVRFFISTLTNRQTNKFICGFTFISSMRIRPLYNFSMQLEHYAFTMNS